MSAPRIKDAIKFRSTIAFLVMAFVSLAIVGKVFYIQFVKGEELRGDHLKGEGIELTYL